MTRPLDVLVIESHRGAGAVAARTLDAAGHRVHRCTDHGGGAPCRGVIDIDDCPVEHAADVALVVRGAGTGVAAVPVEQSTSCALRAGVPVVDMGGHPALDPFGRRLAARLDDDADVVGASEAAAAAALATTQRAVVTMTAPLLRDLGIEPRAVTCAIARDGSQLQVRLDLPVEVDEATKQAVAVRALAALRDARRRHSSVNIGVHCPA